MIKLIPLINNIEWKDYVYSFSNYDIYYTADYLLPFNELEQADIKLLTYEKDHFRLCYPILIKDISKAPNFENLEIKQYFDIETPYGYGGPIVESYTKENMASFIEDFKVWAKENNIVSHFFRFHPLLETHKYLEDFIETKSFKQTVYMDLQNEDIIYSNMNDKCRNMVKKAIKNGISIQIDNSISAQQQFKQLYQKTMQRNNADAYYLFNDKFFDELFKGLGKYCNLFNAIHQNITVSSAIIFEENNFLHYHLSAANTEYMKLAGNNLLLYEVAKYGAKNGYEKFHLGGGVSADDGLFIFKKSFNKNGLKDFYIGRIIFDKEKYNYLMKYRQEMDSNFNINNSRMIGYRA